ncbi:MAG: beta-propeller domain-containing protein [Verrucomicrobia bacterium]|nr:beta-propeller domain-containing protein [Verrucomicrobiota bacterium]
MIWILAVLVLGIGSRCEAGSDRLTAGSAADSASGAGQPTVVSVRVEGTNLVAVVHVPAGLGVVTLEGRPRLQAGAWSPRAVQNVDATGGEVTFRVPMSSNVELIRVRADAQAALPSSFYRGTNAFAGAVSTFDPGASYNSLSPALTPGAVDANGNATSQPRTVVESDIWNLSGNTLYFFNQYRGLQVINLSSPDSPVIRGTFDLPAAGEQMYLIATNYAVLLVQGCGWGGNDDNDVVIVDVTSTNLHEVASQPVSGSILESRLVGSVLYVASQVYQPMSGASNGAWEWGTMVSSFDLSDPTQPVARQQLWYPSSYGSVVTATDQFFFLATQNSSWYQSVVRVIDISDPTGVMVDRKPIQPAGYVADKFKMNLGGSGTNAVFTVISEVVNTTSWTWTPTLQTFSLADPTAPRWLATLQPAKWRGEQLHATRFDGNRVYVVTFRQVDPLFVVDLSDPANPTVAGEVEVPGWSTYIDPLGDKLVTIGVQVSNTWQVAVSLFDVSNPAQPTLVSQLPIGNGSSWSEANYDEKAFGVFPDAGLILVPYQGWYTNGYASAVQLIDLNTHLASTNALVLRGVIQHQFTPRRAAPFGVNHIVSVSGQELLSVDDTDRDRPVVRADLELAWPVDHLFLQGDYLVEIGNGSGWFNQGTPTLHVALAANPDQELGEYSLTNLPVLGATVQGQKLYLAQGPTGWMWPLALNANGDTNGVPATNAPNFFLSVFDLQHLPTVTLLGQTGVVTSALGWNSSWQPVWVKPGLLAWSGGQGFWIMPLMGAGLVGGGAPGPVTATGGLTVSSAPDTSAISAMPIGYGSLRPWWGWGGNGGRLLAFDVTDLTAPSFVSEVNLTTNNWWSFSAPFTTNGLVYLSHQYSEPIVVGTNYVTNYVTPTQPDTNQPPLPSGGGWVTNAYPVYNWVQRWYLDVVDYADPPNPTVRPPVNIPGTLQGVSAAGALLYTTGPHWDTNGVTDWNDWLDASAYDGVSAHLVDSVMLSTNWPHPVLVLDTNLFIGSPSSATNTPDQLEVWTLPASGQFSRLGATPLKASANVLAGFGSLLAVQESDSRLELFNDSDPAALGLVGSGKPSGCLWYNLPNADGTLDQGLWLPLGDYGVSVIPVRALP